MRSAESLTSEPGPPQTLAMKSKEPYEKPELVVIELKAEEVLAVGCKNVGKNAVGVPICGEINRCNQRGS
jgi:hypothetical protein